MLLDFEIGNISITGTEKLDIKKGASIIKEKGSNRASNEPFDDDVIRRINLILKNHFKLS